jgi:UDP-glucose 4-epimerase
MTRGQTVLITGGAGYIGSHAVYAFLDAGYQPVVLDNLSTGTRAVLPDSVPFVEADAGDQTAVAATLRQYGCRAVVHFAGSIVVPESVTNPLKYYKNNSAVSRDLLEASVAAGIDAFLFSSTAAVYGQPEVMPISEATPCAPINPYGASKMVTEHMLCDVAAAHGFQYGILRYFNVAGADPEGRTGQCTPEATHLIKVASQAVTGQRPQVSLFGTDYPTPDGTCIRDYIHVTDLAEAHVRTLEYLLTQRASVVFNCGYGHGYSVREVLETVGTVAGAPLKVVETDRRAGDPPCLVADNRRICATLGWQPRLDDLPTIVKTALDWELKLCAPHSASSVRQAALA